MRIDELIERLEPGECLTVLNEPFEIGGCFRLSLDGGESHHWAFDLDGECLLAVSADAEEIILFHPVEEELEPAEEGVFYQGLQFELSYEDSGVAADVDGDLRAEPDDRFMFGDYESGARRMRFIVNDNTGEKNAYIGRVMVEDDIMVGN